MKHIKVLNGANMTDIEKLESKWQELGKKYHKVIHNDGWTGLAIMRSTDKSGFIYVPNHGYVELKDYGQLPDFIEFSPEGSRKSASKSYGEWWQWLKDNESQSTLQQLPCTLINQDLLITDKSTITFGLIHFPLDSDYKGQWSANTTHNLLDIAFVGTFDEAVRSALLWAESKNLTIKWKEPTLK